MESSVLTHDMLTQKQKNANKNEWYKERCRDIDTLANGTMGWGGIDNRVGMQVNYDLFNNIINMEDFDYVVKPFGAAVGELPATLTNRDIVSAKIKVIHGLELKRPFGWKVFAVNEEATTRKEEKEFGMIREFVMSEIMTPIKQDIELKYQQEQKGQPLTPEEQQRIQQQIAEELKVRTPAEVKKYMQREHQDPAEALMHQILQYLVQYERVEQKFFTGWKHATLVAKEIYYVGISNGEPKLFVVNPKHFAHDNTKESPYIEDSAWARCQYRMTPEQIVNFFGNKLTKQEIEDLYDDSQFGAIALDSDYQFDFTTFDEEVDVRTILVTHYEFVSLRKVGFVTFLDEEGAEQEDMVSENYQLNESLGDIKIDWEWIPQVHETWQIGNDVYKDCRPVLGQHKDIDKLHDPKLSYYGVSYDDLNSQPTSFMDRVKGYQYLYNIVMYRIELLMASDEGKILLMNIKAIPKSLGIDIEKWTYFLKALKIGWVNPSEDGVKNHDVTQMAKEIDMSLVSDIQKYMQIAEYLENKTGSAIGVTKQMEGEIGTSDAVTNTKQSIVQGTTILEPSFTLHSNVKQNVLEALAEKAKVAWSSGKPKKLVYILDDMSLHMLTVNQELLDGSSYGLFVLDSSKAREAKQMAEQLAHAAMQNQTLEMSDVLKVIRSESVQEAEEILEAGEEERHQREQQQQTAQIQAQAEADEKQRAFQKEVWKHEEDMIILKEKERRETELQKATIQALGFAQDKDVDRDMEPDVIEVYKHGLNVMVTQGKLDQMKADTLLKEKQFDHQKEMDNKELEIKKKAAMNGKGKK